MLSLRGVESWLRAVLKNCKVGCYFYKGFTFYFKNSVVIFSFLVYNCIKLDGAMMPFLTQK